MSEATYAITPKELQSAAWRGSLYTLVAAIITGAAIMLLGEALEEIFIATLATFAGVGWASGSAMRHAITQGDQLPARVLAVLFSLLGILGAKFFMSLFILTFSLELPPVEALTETISGFGPMQINWLLGVISFEEPISSIMRIVTPLIGCAVAWRSTTSQGDMLT